MSIELFGLVTGIIGTLTGISSLIWHVLNSRAKLAISNLNLELNGFDPVQLRGYETIGVEINLRNRGVKSTTVEEINFCFHHYPKKFDFFQPFSLQPGSSHRIQEDIHFTNKEFTSLKRAGDKAEYSATIRHTYGKWSRRRKGNLFTTGRFYLVSS
ncbi:hypothetical protein JXB02_06615 [Candidatus Woesearchaeota archaeon]|nr:hypothetical protein [Candidatus Woesearchaeota archaeon]